MSELIEKLASIEHDRWSRWQSYVHKNSILNEDGSLTIPKYFVDRWTRQINTPYDELSESEKESDRKEARISLNIISKFIDHA